MTAHLLDLEALEATLLAKAEECRTALAAARRDLQIERAPEDMDGTLGALSRELAAEKMESAHRLLKQIEVATARLKRGRYGKCMKCEELIDGKRLAAVPWALFCLTCQQA